MYEATIRFLDNSSVLQLFGARDQHVRRIRESLGVTITHRDGQVRISGREVAVAQATKVIEALRKKVERQGLITLDEVEDSLADVTGETTKPKTLPIAVFKKTQRVTPMTPGQATYVEIMREHEMVFALGPAGTGKTYLAVAFAVESLLEQRIRKIVLVRPAVEAGEQLGFLPGTLHEKINPYLQPMLDSLSDMIDRDQVARYMEQNVIEVIPLAFMRGRTLNDAFIILDEAQNTTISQMKMFLTRLGKNSRMVISGDATQNDLPPNVSSGLSDAILRLKDIKGIGQVHLTQADIVRHALVQEIVNAYERGSNSN
ncbi:PhoH family protein [Blastopirellula marina]|uniref:PhoH-like protein n=1 Tax=Blastopirellula marina TaxID=124 RepID=A0A2S8F429_9BACT|nr:PhoH family protein [Blastopirellula marina]PQO26877.1 PhoH family protein [Blastopirellula marina]PQO41565.1 PhoH family protein [Blastopirellula marina]PTL41084.1 PhoH family protein [Blastopirellula marina]